MKSEEAVADAIGLNNKTRPCQEWSYDTSSYPRTIITDVNICHSNLASYFFI